MKKCDRVCQRAFSDTFVVGMKFNYGGRLSSLFVLCDGGDKERRSLLS
jgi:hypothetical protein